MWRLVKVRVYYKHPFSKKSGTMQMTEAALAWERSNPKFSPYKRIVRIK